MSMAQFLWFDKLLATSGLNFMSTAPLGIYLIGKLVTFNMYFTCCLCHPLGLLRVSDFLDFLSDLVFSSDKITGSDFNIHTDAENDRLNMAVWNTFHCRRCLMRIPISSQAQWHQMFGKHVITVFDWSADLLDLQRVRKPAKVGYEAHRVGPKYRLRNKGGKLY